MPAESHFFPEYHLLYGRMYGIITPEEIGAAQAVDVKFLTETEPSVHILVDLRGLETEHRPLSEMKNILTPMDTAKILWIVFVVPINNPILPFFVSVTTQIAAKGGRIKTVTSLEEAIDFLQYRDLTLDHLRDLIPEIERQSAANA